MKQIKDLTDKFNGWMERCIFVNIDEANSEDTYNQARAVVNALKNWITEPIIGIRHMQASAINRNSYVNFLFTTNDFGVLPIQDGDRRFNVAPRQEVPISITPEEIEQIRNELQNFAGYLHSYEVDEIAADTPLDDSAKADLKVAAETSIDSFFRALHTGDLEYFISGMDETTTEYDSLAQFKAAVATWMDDAQNGKTSEVTESDLRNAHIVLCRDKGMKSATFRSMCAKRGTPIKRLGIDGGRWRGWAVDWKLTDDAKAYYNLHLKVVKTDDEISADIVAEIKREKKD